jgi:adenosylcobinamide kinase / adenosylcobinamide-phosphate guanylyltransferase
MTIHLIVGGARSGKSAYAEKLASQSELPVIYIATAQVYDEEFKQRVAHHQARRPKFWQLVEAPFNLAQTLMQHDQADICLIVDCLTLWLAQCICPDCAPSQVNSDQAKQSHQKLWEKERAEFLAQLKKVKGNIILVSNEVGMGIVQLIANFKTSKAD